MKHNFEISYAQQGDYLLPDLRLPEQPKVEIGICGTSSNTAKSVYQFTDKSCKLHKPWNQVIRIISKDSVRRKLLYDSLIKHFKTDVSGKFCRTRRRTQES